MGYWNGHEWESRTIAPVGTRIWTFLVDLFIISLIWFVLAVIAAIPGSGQESGSLSNAVGIVIIFLAPAVAFVGYFAIFYATSGSSLGMMLGKLSVVDISAGPQPLSWGKAFLRALVLLVGVYFLITALIWLVVTAGSRTRQGPHDLAAKTIVLRQGKVQRPMPATRAAAPANTSVEIDTIRHEAQQPPVISADYIETVSPRDVATDRAGASVSPETVPDRHSEPEVEDEALADPLPANAVNPSADDAKPVIFISHATEDADTAIKLSDELESQGLHTWLASRDVGIGTNYAAEIVRAVSNAQYLLVLLSPASIESPHVRREVSIAIDRHVPVLPVSTDPTGEFMADLPVDWTYWLSLAQVFRMSDAASTAVEIARRVG